MTRCGAAETQQRQAYPLSYARSRSSGGLERSLPHHDRPPVWGWRDGWMAGVIERATTGIPAPRKSSSCLLTYSLQLHGTEHIFSQIISSPHARGHGGHCSLHQRHQAARDGGLQGPSSIQRSRRSPTPISLLIDRRAHQCRCRNIHHYASNSPPCPFFVTFPGPGPFAGTCAPRTLRFRPAPFYKNGATDTPCESLR